MPRLACVKGFQRFTGSTNYLSKFMPNLSDMCEPPRSLTKTILSGVGRVSKKSYFKNVNAMQPYIFSSVMHLTKDLGPHYFRKVRQSVLLHVL